MKISLKTLYVAHHLFFLNILSEVILDLQKRCKASEGSGYILLVHFTLLLLVYIIVIQLWKLRNPHQYIPID